MTATVETRTVPAASASPNQSSEFGRTAMAILGAMLFLIVALTGILVETTWHHPVGQIEAMPPEPGSFAQR